MPIFFGRRENILAYLSFSFSLDNVGSVSLFFNIHVFNSFKNIFNLIGLTVSDILYFDFENIAHSIRNCTKPVVSVVFLCGDSASIVTRS